MAKVMTPVIVEQFLLELISGIQQVFLVKKMRRNQALVAAQRKGKPKSLHGRIHLFALRKWTKKLFLSMMNGAILQIAGLGEKAIQLAIDSNANDVYYEILANFPKLQDCGGYELLGSHAKGSKLLEVIQIPPSGYTTAYLKAVVHNA